MNRPATCLAGLMIFSAIVSAGYAEPPKPTGDSAILPDGATLERLWNKGEFTEGVAVADDGSIYFSDIAFNPEDNGRIMKFDPETGHTTVHAEKSYKSNGLMFDAKGRLIACCGSNLGKRALCRVTPKGKMKVIVGKYRGQRFNSPNDLVIHPNGSIYFSDPRYVGPEPMAMQQMSVYRYNPSEKSLIRLTASRKNGELPLIEKPNGVHVSPDGKWLYVAETNNGTTDISEADEVEKGRMTLNALPIREDGSLGKKRVLVDFGKQTGTDGMAVDLDGNIYAAVRAEERHGIIVFTPDGKERAYIPTKPLPTNCCFGIGEDASTLYITAGKGLYRIALKKKGVHPAR